MVNKDTNSTCEDESQFDITGNSRSSRDVHMYNCTVHCGIVDVQIEFNKGKITAMKNILSRKEERNRVFRR